MFEDLIAAIEQHPYLGIGIVFVLCGMGFPLPEELVLLAGGYICHDSPEKARLPWMMLWSAVAILCGDLIPFVLGRVFGTRLLRIRWMRMLVTRQRLAKFDRWFRRRGDLVIFVARFLAGIRMVAFFTAGTMKMGWIRFLTLDLAGIVVIVPLLVYVGWSSGEVIDKVLAWIKRVERGLLFAAIGTALAVGVWFWLSRRRRLQRQPHAPTEAFVEPRVPPTEVGSVTTDTAAPTEPPRETGNVDPEPPREPGNL